MAIGGSGSSCYPKGSSVQRDSQRFELRDPRISEFGLHRTEDGDIAVIKKNVRTLIQHLTKQRDSRRAARFNMKFWGMSVKHFGNYDLQYLGLLRKPVCKTMACLAGETVLAFRAGKLEKHGGIRLKYDFMLDRDVVNIRDAAKLILGISEPEADRLFYVKADGRPGWPAQYQAAYESAATPKERLQVTINRVRHFLKTDGAE